MKTNKAFALKLFAIVLSLMLVFSAFPISALAEDEYTEDETVAYETQPEETPETPDGQDDLGDSEDLAPAGEYAPSGANGDNNGTDNPNPDIDPPADPTEPPMALSDGFYLIGPAAGESDDTGWTVSGIRANQKFTANPKNSDEMMLYTSLEVGRKLKVVKIVDGAISAAGEDGKDSTGEFVWYPNGMGGEYTVEEDLSGDVVVYFRKEAKNDWTLCGGHLYIDKEVEVEEGGETNKVPVAKDETDPTLKLEGYAKAKDGGFADWADYATAWVSASEKIYAKLTADDNVSINDNSFMVKDSKGEYRLGNAKYSDGFYYVKLTESKPVSITVKDNAGNTSDPVQTAELNIDKDIPTPADIVGVTFKKHEEKSFLNILTFGLYSNSGGIDVTVAVSPNNGSPITGIEMSDGSAALVTGGDITTYNDAEYGTVYERTFNLPDKDTAYDLKVCGIEDEVGYKFTDTVDVLKLPLFADNRTAIESLYEIASVSERILPSITVDSESISPSPVNEIYNTTEEAPLSMTVEFKEVVSGLDESSLKAYFAPADAFGDAPYDFTKSGITEISLTENVSAESTYGSEELSGKLVGKKITFSVPAELTNDTDTYRLVFTATGNGGRSFTKAADFDIDNEAPEIKSHKVLFVDDNEETKELTQGQWTDKDISVEFKVTDAGNKFEKGALKFEVTGTVSGKLADDAVTPVEGKEDTYSLKVEQHEGFTVTVTDVYGHVSEPLVIDPSEIGVDNDAPVISNVLYDGVSYEESKWKTGDGDPENMVTVSFDVTDKSEIGGEQVWLSGRDQITATITGEDGNSITITAEKDKENDNVIFDEAKDCWTFSFTSASYQKYTITAVDKAGNQIADEDATVTESTKADRVDPYFTFFEIKPENDTVLHIITFGLYSSKKITVTVNAADVVPSSGIKDITATYNGDPATEESTYFKPGKLTTSGEALPEEKNDTNAPTGINNDPEAVKTATASRIFTIELNNEEAYDPALFEFTVTDNSGRSVTKKLTELDTENETFNGVIDTTKTYEIVVNNENPIVGEIKLTADPEESPVYEDERGVWYPGNVEANVQVQSGISHLHAVTVKLNGDNDITAECKDGNKDALPAQFTAYEEKDDNNKKIDYVDVTLKTSAVEGLLHKTSDKDAKTKGENTITVIAESNEALKSEEAKKSFFIDDVAPRVTGFEFDSSVSADVNDVTDGVVETDYGYFFQRQTTVRIYVTDTVEGVDGAGVQSVTYYGVSKRDEFGSKNIEEKTVEPTTENGKTYIEFVVEAGFKGNIFASAKDFVGNEGHVYSAKRAIVENDEQHAAASDISMNIVTNAVTKDNQGIDLYDGDVAIDLEIKDLYSGLREVSYRIIDTANPEPDFITHTFLNDDGTSDAGDWTVNDSEENLIYRVSKQITVEASAHNDNNVRIQFKGIDNAGFEIAQIEKAISIDITNPIVQVEYNPLLNAANHYGDNYYFNADRTATITVTERNFNPNDFDLSKFVAVEGNRPALVGGDKWSTEYDYEAAGNGEQRTATHKATITFAEDGKYDVDFDFKDLVGHAAEKKFEKETFYIDKTKPTRTVELVSEVSAENGKYYRKTVTARITVVEHNFTSEEPYFVYTGSAYGEDNHTPAALPQVTGWTTEGDTHHATITFSADGNYSFKIVLKDLANNQGEDFTQDVFYVDQTINKPEIKNVENHKGYDGEVAPIIDFEDNNFDYANYSYSLTKHWYDLDKMAPDQMDADYDRSEDRKYSGTGLTVTYSDFERTELAEGIYEIKAKMTDLAGNSAESDSMVFSVNRFGSVFVLGSANTTSLVEKGYTADAPDVAIKEINVNESKSHKVSISHDSSSKELTEGTDYTIKKSGGSTSWYETMYLINSSNFASDGEYTVTVTSVDYFDNTVTNLTANTESPHERNCPVSFVVDKQDPEVKISGVDEDGYYSEAEKTLHIVCLDENIDKSSLAVKLDDQPYDVPEEYINLDLVGEIEIDLPITAQNGETRHKIEVAVKDLANNSGDDMIGAFTLSATFLTMFFHNTTALIITGAVLAGLIALAVVLIMKKRKGVK